MKKKYKRALAAALAAVMIWNTCDWHPQVLAGSSVQYIEEVKELSDEILHQEVLYGTKYKDLELPDKLKKHRMKKTVQKRLLRRRSFKAETVKWKQKKSLRRFLHLKQMVQFGKHPHLRQMLQKNRK